MPVVEGTRLGGYRVVRKIGEGGMGAVFEGIHERLQKRVAIKTLHDQFARDASAVARFTREGRAASRIRHGHVIDVSDVGMENGTPYLIMELLDGESLAALIKRHGPLSMDAIADIALPVCDALDAAHAAGIIHRDLKPENIFLARNRSGTEAHPMVLDFGISAIEDEVRMTKTAHFMGTPHYMSPEQAQSARSVDGRSDQFSLGLVLFELVTGRRALTGDSVLEVVHRVSTQGAIRLGQVRPDLPWQFSSIIDRMTERDVNQRYPSVRAAGAALLPFASPRGQALWGHAFAAGTVRSSIPIPAASSLPPPSPSRVPEGLSPTGSIPLSVPSSFQTKDAPRASFSTPGSATSGSTPGASMPSTRPPEPSAPAAFRTPGQAQPSYTPRSSNVGSQLATGPTLDARRVSRAPASEPPPAPPKTRSPVLLAVIAVALVACAVGIAFVVGTTLAHQQTAAAATTATPPSSVAPPPTAALPPSPPDTTTSPPTTPIATLDVRLRAMPASAEIVLDGVVVGTGTYAGSVARDGIPHLLEVRAEGYVPHDIQFLDIAPVATIALDELPRHHHGPVVAQHSAMTSTGLVEAAAPPPPQVHPTAPTTSQGLAAPTDTTVTPPPTTTATLAPTAGAVTTAGAPHETSGGQVAGSGAGGPPTTTAAPPPTTTAETAPPPPTTTAAPPPPTTTHDDWETGSTDDDLVPFQ